MKKFPIMLDSEEISVHNIYFNPYELILDDVDKSELLKVFNYLKTKNGYKLELKSYTDATGSKSENKRYSRLRAQEVKQFLIDQQLDGSIISYNALGEDSLNMINNCWNSKYCDKELHHMNRRIELVIKDSNGNIKLKSSPHKDYKAIGTFDDAIDKETAGLLILTNKEYRIENIIRFINSELLSYDIEENYEVRKPVDVSLNINKVPLRRDHQLQTIESIQKSNLKIDLKSTKINLDTILIHALFDGTLKEKGIDSVFVINQTKKQKRDTIKKLTNDNLNDIAKWKWEITPRKKGNVTLEFDYSMTYDVNEETKELDNNYKKPVIITAKVDAGDKDGASEGGDNGDDSFNNLWILLFLLVFPNWVFNLLVLLQTY